jgi:lipopolysaccharide/colanic/teichoic acid biosynthesis glycosyltransferase
MYRVAQSKAKRVFDVAIATPAIIVLSPLMCIIALAIKLSSRGPVVFKQQRCGMDNRPFTIYKFRTMIEGAQNKGLGYEVARDDDRITTVGKLLRNSSLDELPQLANIIRGDMSLMGPRPMIADQVGRLNSRQMLRQQARPGISGWAQVNGRNALDWSRRIELDIWYVENWDFLLDLRIFWKTIIALLHREGIYGEGGVNRTVG